MIKNQANIYQFVLRDMIGQGITGLSPTVRIRKDSGSFAATTNTPTEVGYGAYEVILTATECNCDVMMFMVTLPDGQFPAILENEHLITTGGATPAEIWGYTGGRTIDNTIPTVNDIWGRQAGDTTSRTITNTIPSASDNATAVWGAQTKEVTIATAQADTFATASSVANIATVAGAIKAKTDNLPQSPAAVGSEMTLTSTTVTAVKSGLATGANIEAALGALEMYGDTNWHTASTTGLATGQGLENLATYGDAHWATAAGFATPSDVAAAVESITAALPSDYAKATDVSSAQTALTALINSVLSGIFHWAVEGSILTIYNASNVAIGAYTLTKDSSGNITAVTPIVQPETNAE